MKTYDKRLTPELLVPQKSKLARTAILAVLWAVPGLFSAGQAVGAEKTVAMLDNFFSPGNLTVAPGDTIKWVNNGNMPHTTTSNTGLWDSGIVNPGGAYSALFNNPGTYPYHCTVHGLAMSGTITVTSGSGGGPKPDLFLASLSGLTRTTNAAGKFKIARLKTKDIVKDCAEENQRDPTTLALVYDVPADAIEVVERATGSNVCTVATFAGGVTVPTADGKRKDRQAFVFWEDSEEANGSIVATELSARGTNGVLLKFNLHGSMQVGFEAYEEEPPKIFQGMFFTGRRLFP